MDVEWNLERFCPLQNRPKKFIIQVAASCVTVDISSFETMFINHVLSSSAAMSGAAVGRVANPAKRFG
jgi:hypothetical protein